MKTIVKTKHWQIFGAFITIGIFKKVVDIQVILGNVSESISDIFYIAFITATIGWIVVTGIALKEKLKPSNEIQFRGFIITGLLLIISTSTLRLIMTTSDTIVMMNNRLLFIGFPIYLIVSLFIICGFTAKKLKSNEVNGEVGINDYFGDIFLLLFLPIGIWFIQPRVNRIFMLVDK